MNFGLIDWQGFEITIRLYSLDREKKSRSFFCFCFYLYFGGVYKLYIRDS